MQISFWEKEAFYFDRDIIIAGAGLCGLWCAYELIKKNKNLKILIIEKGVSPYGASTRNAGFACFGSATELLQDEQKLGEEKMLEIAQMRFDGIEKIKKIFAENEIGFDATFGFECITKDLHDIDKLKQDVKELNKIIKFVTNSNETFTWQKNKLKTFGLAGFDELIENKFEAGIHSGKLVDALTKKLRALNVDIITGVEITNWEEHNSSIKIFTRQNIELKSKHLLICTNSFTKSLLPTLNITPARGQILITNEIEALKLNGTFHFDEGFYYFRNVGKRVLLGGARNIDFENEETNVFDISEKIQQRLETFLSTNILQNIPYVIEQRWSGIMAFTEDKLPMIKDVSKRVTMVTACNGMGLALTPIIAEKVAKNL